MGGIAATIGVGIIAFASTDLDDLILLVAFFADPSFRPWQVVVGQFAGIAILIAVSLLGSLFALTLPEAYVGLLGVVPMALGAARLMRGGEAAAEAATATGGGRIGRFSKPAAVALATVANGGDNLALYIPLFAGQRDGESAILVAVFLAMTALWCLLGHALVARQRRGPAARRWGRVALPFVLIALGLYILAKAGTVRLITG